MLKYSKIINEETKEVSIALGSNPPNDYMQMDVEQAYNGAWYVAGYAPEESQEEKKAKLKKELIAELDALDLKCIRALRAIQSGKSTDADTVILADFEKEAETIRKELRNLED